MALTVRHSTAAKPRTQASRDVLSSSHIQSLNVQANTTAGIMLAETRVGDLRIVSRGGASQWVFLSNVEVTGSTDLQFGAGRDRAVIVDSIFQGPTRLDGGEDYDVLELARNRFARLPRIVNWEEIRRGVAQDDPEHPRR